MTPMFAACNEWAKLSARPSDADRFCVLRSMSTSEGGTLTDNAERAFEDDPQAHEPPLVE